MTIQIAGDMNKTVSPMPSYRMMNLIIYRTGGFEDLNRHKNLF